MLNLSVEPCLVPIRLLVPVLNRVMVVEMSGLSQHICISSQDSTIVRQLTLVRSAQTRVVFLVRSLPLSLTIISSFSRSKTRRQSSRADRKSGAAPGLLANPAWSRPEFFALSIQAAPAVCDKVGLIVEAQTETLSLI